MRWIKMSEVTLLIPKKLAVDEATVLREKLENLLSQGHIHFLLDFSSCTFIDSIGLGVLVTIYKKCKEMRGSFKLLSISTDLMRIFYLTRLDQVFDIQ